MDSGYLERVVATKAMKNHSRARAFCKDGMANPRVLKSGTALLYLVSISFPVKFLVPQFTPMPANPLPMEGE